jgi:hypothetical protein
MGGYHSLETGKIGLVMRLQMRHSSLSLAAREAVGTLIGYELTRVLLLS